MKSRFFLTPSAKSDLDEILLSIAEDCPVRAEHLRRELRASLLLPGQSPGVGHCREDLMERRYRFWNCHSFLLCYRWEACPIQVIAIVHGSRELHAFLGKRVER